MQREDKAVDVLIIGAGAAGLSAALELCNGGKRVLLLEARDRVGGRIDTVVDRATGAIIEKGAEFIHGNLPKTLGLLEAAGMKTLPLEGSFWKYDNGVLKEADVPVDHLPAILKKLEQLPEDISVNRFISEHLQEPLFKDSSVWLRTYISGYSAADPDRASTFALREDLQGTEEEQYRPADGYGQLVDYLVAEVERHGGQIRTSHPVEKVRWSRGHAGAFAAGAWWHAPKVIITVPLGVLQQEKIRFEPAIPQLQRAVKDLGFGNVIKITMQFKTAFWKDNSLTRGADLKDLSFLFTEEAIPTWWTGDPSAPPSLTGWLGGTLAYPYLDATDDELTDLALQCVLRIFNIPEAELKEVLVESMVTAWHRDPYACGAYSYAVAGADSARAILASGVEETVLFAGEALHPGPEIGTVEGALLAGAGAAKRILRS